MPKKLTAELISQKAKNPRIETITQINLWGNDLDDISVLSQMPLLKVISLAVNKIHSLKYFSNMQNLEELHLRDNLITDFREIKYLSTCPKLRVLSLSQNPIAEDPSYRSNIIRLLPNLSKLDEKDITDYERERNSVYRNEQGNNNYYMDSRYHYQNMDYDDMRGVPNQRNYNYENDDRNEYGYNDYYKYEQEQRGYRQFSDKNYYDNYDNYNHQNNHISNSVPEMQMRRQYTQNRDNEYHRGEYYNNENDHQENKGSNIMNCLLMLLRELNDNELDYIKGEIDKKISKF